MKMKRSLFALLAVPALLAACDVPYGGSEIPPISEGSRLAGEIAASERARTRNLRNEVLGIESYLVRHLGEDRSRVLDMGDAVLVSFSGQGAFNGQSDNLTRAGTDIVARISAALLEYPHARVGVVGHIRKRAGDYTKRDQVLSDRRAVMVKSVMMQRGVDDCRIGTLGQGPRDPLASSATQRMDEVNDRIEVLIRPMQDGACN